MIPRNGENGGNEWSRRRLTGMFVFGVVAIGLAAAWLGVRSAALRKEEACRIQGEKIDKVKTFLEKNPALIFAEERSEKTPTPLREKPLISIVKELSAQCGLDDRLLRVVMEENRKLQEMTAKVTFRRVRIADVVNFLTIGKEAFPGLWDREGRMRYSRGGEADAWDVTLSLTAEKP
ncbi:MAG: hypothetical protein ACYS47_06065 [Planctomycetota bacterium]|jgi:hypothetical protein